MQCSNFEEYLSEYLDGTLEKNLRVAAAEHALQCPVCHELLSEVKNAVQLCRTMPAPKVSTARMEARILAMTTPETALSCAEFEELLTDYLDGFLPAQKYHRWERHAALCRECSDLPGLVVRSIGECVTYQTSPLAVPAGLHEKILQATLGTTDAKAIKPSLINQLSDILQNWIVPSVRPFTSPQFAAAALIIVFAMTMFTQNFTDGSLRNIYTEGFEIAQKTYVEGANTVGEKIVRSLGENADENSGGH